MPFCYFDSLLLELPLVVLSNLPHKPTLTLLLIRRVEQGHGYGLSINE